ncbi:MAG: MaoC family dehydratase [Chloroflexota bacterium]|nr:MaoC family dehydratase [Dehalococcoidia bacterium]MDW8253284.1 MaoC family dehydratase [Chloroflexota bacterium]
MRVPLTYKLPKVPEPLDFDWLAEDRGWPELELTISAEEVARWCDLYDDHHPWYTGPSPWGGPVAPNSIFYYAGQNAFPPRRDFNGVLAAIGFEARGPIFVGRTVTARTTITDRWRRRDRLFVAYRLDIFDGATPIAVATRTWAFFGPSRAAERVPERAAQPPQDERPARELLQPVAFDLTLERMRAFEGPGEENGHTSVELAHRHGHPAPLAQGALVIAPVCRMMFARFGAGWQVGGTLDCKIVRPCYAGERVTAHGALVEEVADRVTCRVWVVNERGETAVVGSATARPAAP